MRSESILPKKILSLRSSTIVDMRALPGVDYSQLDTVVQLHRKDATIFIRHWILWTGGWFGLNILDMVRDPIKNSIYANGGSNLIKE